jgi:hypothetical protein
VDRVLFNQVQQVFRGHNKPKYRRHEFAFGGLLNCAYDGCTVTAELKKAKYVYYRCIGHRGKCDLPYMREEQLSERLGKVIEDIHVPNDVLAQLLASLYSDDANGKRQREERRERLHGRLSGVRRRLEQAYLDKLDGKIPEEFWQRKQAEWQGEETDVQQAIRDLEKGHEREFVLNASRILELENKAYFLYFHQTTEEKAKLLKMVVSNCRIDAVSLYPTYRKPFGLICERAKTKEWSTMEHLRAGSDAEFTCSGTPRMHAQRVYGIGGHRTAAHHR